MAVNIVFIPKSLYSQFHIFKRAQDTRSWKLLRQAVLKYTVHTRLETRSSITDIFNLFCLVGTMLQVVLATGTDSEINILKNMAVTTSTQIIKLQHVQ